MLLLIDNYDSFAHNLARYFERLGAATHVVRNDAVDIASVREMQPDAIVLSPGPCTPREAGASLDIVRSLYTEIPLLGVCLGHQVIAEALGGEVVRAETPVHGRTSAVLHESAGLFAGVPAPLTVGRYHSLVVEPESLPSELRVTAWTAGGVIMALEHVRWPAFGVQFHPESILTEHGYDLLANFLGIAGIEVAYNPNQLAASERCEPARTRRPLPTEPVTF